MIKLREFLIVRLIMIKVFNHWSAPGLFICKYQVGQKWPVLH